MPSRDSHHMFQSANNIGLLGVTEFLGSKILNLELNNIPQQWFRGIWLHLSTYPTYSFPLFECSAIYRSREGEYSPSNVRMGCAKTVPSTH